MSFLDFLTQSARVESRAVVRKGYTDTTPNWTLVPGLDAVGCMVRPLRPEAVVKQGRDMQKTWVRIYIDADLDMEITREYRLVIDGQAYSIQGQLDFNSMAECVCVDAFVIKT